MIATNRIRWIAAVVMWKARKPASHRMTRMTAMARNTGSKLL